MKTEDAKKEKKNGKKTRTSDGKRMWQGKEGLGRGVPNAIC